MWKNTIASLKENLNQMALEVHDASDDEDAEIYRSRNNSEDSPISDRRVSHHFAQSKSPLLPPTANGIDSRHNDEIEQYKAELQRVHESEAQMKTLSVNYAALLKDKEKQILRLHEENESLRKNFETSNNGWYSSTTDSSRTKQHIFKATNEKSPGKLHGHANQIRTNSSVNHTHKGTVPKQDALSNGIQLDGLHKGNGKELAGIREEHSRSLEAMQARYESEIKELKTELAKERDNSATIQLKLQGRDRSSQSSQEELLSLKLDKDQHNREMKEIQNELVEKISELRRLQLELTRRDNEQGDETIESLKSVIAGLQQERSNLKKEKDELESALKLNANFANERSKDDLNIKNSNEVPAITFPEKKEMQQSIQRLEQDLKGACQERDKAVQELNRLKKHLLDKELEESDKMDEDSRVIEELREHSSYQRAQILHLEKAVKQAIEGQEDIKKANYDELQKSKEMISELQQKLASCVKTIDAKNSELLNLQTALGQYYAESEAKERLERDLVLAREESAKLSELLKDVNRQVDVLNREKEEILIKLSQTEKMTSDGKHTLRKLEEDNTKLRRALEQSMTRLNRMSLDSDYFVDRRIVIKLLVTYFQRNHSKEVLDLMVRMLGFSEEDKQRIGVAQQGSGKGVVRGVLGLPGRLVGGILGGTPGDGSSGVPADNQSFADLWVDFLLKETEERERRELMENNTQIKSPSSGEAQNFGYSDQNTTPQRNNSETEFSTVPLTSSVSPSSESRSRISRLLRF